MNLAGCIVVLVRVLQRTRTSRVCVCVCVHNFKDLAHVIVETDKSKTCSVDHWA